MIGNDIVDLKFAGINSRWKEQRFLKKLFTKNEQTYILDNDCRYQNIWRLWSMKESAYKIQSHIFRESIFNPKFFNCEIISETSGTVFFDDKTINTTTKIESKLIYTTAQIEDNRIFSKHVELIELSQADKSIELKKKAIHAFSQIKLISEKDILIEKDNFGVPKFFIKGKVQKDFLTLTHHGDYGGFAMFY